MNNINKDFCCDDFSKAKKILEGANSCKYCYVLGPTGPQGGPGPIGPQGEIGPKGDMGLQGPKGDRGDIGPTGPKGENGPTTITVGQTETVESTSLAEVTNTGTNKDVILNFKIPKGATGEMGPKGEKGDQGEVGPRGPAGPATDVAYGERYLDLEQELVLTKDKDTVVPLNLGEPAFFTYFDTENTIEIKQNGFYLISYFFSASPSEDCKITAMVKYNDLLFQACNVTTDMKANTIGNITNTIIGALNDGDKVTLCVRSSVNTTLTFDGSTSANLVLVRIH